MHGIDIQLQAHARPCLVQRRRRTTVVNAVEVVTPAGREAGVETVVDFSASVTALRCGRTLPLMALRNMKGPSLGQVHMGHLARGMHASIGAARAIDAGWPLMVESAASSTPCTEGWSSCNCQPQNACRHIRW